MNKDILKITTILCSLSILPIISQANEWETIDKTTKTKSGKRGTSSTTIQLQDNEDLDVYSGDNRIVTDTTIKNSEGTTVATGTTTIKNGEADTTIKNSKGTTVATGTTTTEDGVATTTIKNSEGTTVATATTTDEDEKIDTSISTTNGGKATIKYGNQQKSIGITTAEGGTITKDSSSVAVTTAGGGSVVVNSSGLAVTTAKGKKATVTHSAGDTKITTKKGVSIDTTRSKSTDSNGDNEVNAERTFTDTSNKNTITTNRNIVKSSDGTVVTKNVSGSIKEKGVSDTFTTNEVTTKTSTGVSNAKNRTSKLKKGTNLDEHTTKREVNNTDGDVSKNAYSGDLEHVDSIVPSGNTTTITVAGPKDATIDITENTTDSATVTNETTGKSVNINETTTDSATVTNANDTAESVNVSKNATTGAITVIPTTDSE